MAFEFCRKKRNQIQKRYPKFRTDTFTKEIGMIKQRYGFDNTFNIQVTFILVSSTLGFITGQLERFIWWIFNFFTSFVRILLCCLDRCLTQGIEEIPKRQPFTNLHNICGICEGLDGGIGSIVQIIQLCPLLILDFENSIVFLRYID